MFVISIVVALMAMLGALIAAGFGWRAFGESKTNATSGGGGGQAMVSLTEFAVSDASVGVGGSLHVMDEGAVVHTLAIDGTDLTTAELASGGDEVLELGDLPAGAYAMYCTIPGHREAGMEAELTVTDAGAPAAAWLPASGTPCSSSSTSRAPGSGTATSSRTSRTSTGCSAW
jgi:plastocyanin